MLKIITNFWSKFKTQPDVWFFYAFLFVFTLSIRKVLFHFPIRETFNEYTSIYIYLSDVFLILAMSLWLLFILSNKLLYLSSNKLFFRFIKLRLKLYIKQYLIVDKLWIKKITHNLYLILPSLLVLLSFISITWSNNQKIALFRSIKLLEFYFLYLYLIFRIVPHGTILKNILKIILVVAIFHSVVSVVQFTTQDSIGLTFFRESLISSNIPGVAKLVLAGNKYIRAYGLFPHPNILGGFLFSSIMLTLLANKVQLIKNKKFIQCIIMLQIVALILSFSKSAMLALILGLIYIFWKIKKLFHMEQFRMITIIFFIIFVFFFLIIQPDLNSIFFQSLNERLFYLDVSRGTILTNPILGIGVGQFVASISNFTNKIIPTWQYQPVHNVFLLIWSELGIIGLGLFIQWLWKIFRKEIYKHTILENNNYNLSSNISLVYLKAILLGFIFIILFDHYLWDIQQGQTMLWLTLGLIAGISKK